MVRCRHDTKFTVGLNFNNLCRTLPEVYYSLNDLAHFHFIRSCIQLMEYSLKLARSKGFKFALAECTGAFSTKMAASAGADWTLDYFVH